MDVKSALRLIVLSAIWGASFLFMRVGAPVFGPALLIELRLLVAALFLGAVALWAKRRLEMKYLWRHYLIIGVLNTALPLLLFAYAAQTLSASLLSILNSTAPLYGAIVAAIWLRTPMNKSIAIGLAIGIGGVTVLAGSNASMHGDGQWIALICGLLAPLGYAIAGSYAKASVVGVDPFSNAHGSIWMAAFVILPLLFIAPANHAPVLIDWLAVVALGLLCTGFAYLWYFRLIDDIGPTRALTVTFLIPVFGVLWGNIFLHEPLGWNMVLGGAMVLLGAALTNGVLRFSSPVSGSLEKK
jgi:drug/metabolite transporter (DMT)-like permease